MDFQAIGRAALGALVAVAGQGRRALGLPLAAARRPGALPRAVPLPGAARNELAAALCTEEPLIHPTTPVACLPYRLQGYYSTD